MNDQFPLLPAVIILSLFSDCLKMKHCRMHHNWMFCSSLSINSCYLSETADLTGQAVTHDVRQPDLCATPVSCIGEQAVFSQFIILTRAGSILHNTGFRILSWCHLVKKLRNKTEAVFMVMI